MRRTRASGWKLLEIVSELVSVGLDTILMEEELLMLRWLIDIARGTRTRRARRPSDELLTDWDETDEELEKIAPESESESESLGQQRNGT